MTVTRIIKLALSAVVGAWDILHDQVCRLSGVANPSRCVILYYHSIPAGSRGRFARQLDVLLAVAAPIRVDDSREAAAGGRYVAVTFDDGLRDVFENALPELACRSIPSTHFIVAGALGQRPGWATHAADSPPGEQVVPLDQLTSAMSSPLVCIGSHTVTHPDLPTLTEAQARWELSESRRLLEQAIGRRVDLFSFPYGAFSPELVRWCAEAGYRRVFTSRPSFSSCDASNYVWGRVPASPDDWPIEFRLKISGAYRWVPAAIRLKQFCRGVLASAAGVAQGPTTART